MRQGLRKPASRKQLEARIVAEKQRDGRVRVYCFCPQTNRAIGLNIKVHPYDVESEVRKLKNQLERAGNHVTFKEIG